MGIFKVDVKLTQKFFLLSHSMGQIRWAIFCQIERLYHTSATDIYDTFLGLFRGARKNIKFFHFFATTIQHECR